MTGSGLVRFNPVAARASANTPMQRRRFAELFTRSDDDEDNDDESDDSATLDSARLKKVDSIVDCFVPKNTAAVSAASWDLTFLDTVNSFLPNPVPLAVAQKSRVLRLSNIVSDKERSELVEMGDRILDGRVEYGFETRSAGDESWRVAFLNTHDLFEKREGYGWLIERIVERVREAGGREWDMLKDEEYGQVEVRCVEYHRQIAPGPGINDMRHYDMDSVFTVDVMLSEEGEFEGGVFQTLEVRMKSATHLALERSPSSR